MKPVIRYQSQLLYRKSYRPNRIIRIRSTLKPGIAFRPTRRVGLEGNPALMNLRLMQSLTAAQKARNTLFVPLKNGKAPSLAPNTEEGGAT